MYDVVIGMVTDLDKRRGIVRIQEGDRRYLNKEAVFLLSRQHVTTRSEHEIRFGKKTEGRPPAMRDRIVLEVGFTNKLNVFRWGPIPSS